MIGTTLGKYDVLEEIGRGGMAVVYRGYDRELEREVAIKILHPHLSSQPESKRRFHREARAVARLRHSNILEIFDYSGKDSEQSYIVTEFIHGVTLRKHVENHIDMPIEVAALIALEICRGLRHAHQNEVIHRDIKPENIMIRNDGVVKITDFGIATMAGSTQMTMTGQILGSPAHMSPEHVENKPLDFRADIFSMGTLLYWTCTRRLPFEGRNPHAVIKRIMGGEYTDPVRVNPVIGEHLGKIIRRCLQVNPDDRYNSVDELVGVLEDFLKDINVSVTGRELRRYFRDPTGYTEQHQQKLLTSLVQRGKEERRAKRLPQALHYFNRALSIDETNEEVLTIIEGMTAANRLRRVLETGAVVVTVLAALGGLAYGFWGTEPESSVGVGSVGSDAELEAGRIDAGFDRVDALLNDATLRKTVSGADSVVPATTDDSGAERADGHPNGGSTTGAHRVHHHPTIKRLVKIVPNPPAARIVINGRDFGEYGAQLARGIKLAPGSYRVRLIPRDDQRAPLNTELRVPEGPASEVIRWNRDLPFAPATVNISCTAPEATVYVPGRERSRANRVFQVRMTAARELVRMIVSAEGFRSTELNVELEAGAGYSQVVTLEPENQATGADTRTP